MDLDYPPDVEPFRVDVRQWLARNVPDGWREPHLSKPRRDELQRSWSERLLEGGWVCATWPVELGGRGLSTIEGVVLAEEFARAGVPMRGDFFGDTLVGPTILQWGSKEQKAAFVPSILRGDVRWCQGFSEPDAGSDLASLRTAARVDGDEWVIDGQKTWTTGAHEADYCFLLARTEPEAPKHRGISYLLVPMRQPGVTIRPIAQMDGSCEFNEVFFDGARCPVVNVVGGRGNGWRVAMSTLGFERGHSATTSHRRFARSVDQVIELARRTGRAADPVVRQQLAAAWSRVRIMEVNGYRALTDILHGTEQARALGSLNKVFWSEHQQRVLNLAIDLGGMGGQVLTGSGEGEFVPGAGMRIPRAGYPVSSLQGSFLFSRADTIWGGTAEVQRDLIAERVLGLPKDRREVPT